MGRARNLLWSYYGASDMQPTTADEVDDVNIDGAVFNVEKYVSNLLQYKSLEELAQRVMQWCQRSRASTATCKLVYENYNKFISATDTIRKMKNRVEVRFSIFLFVAPQLNLNLQLEKITAAICARRIWSPKC